MARRMSNYPQNAEELAKELLDIQMGSAEEAADLAEDIPDAELREAVLQAINDPIDGLEAFLDRQEMEEWKEANQHRSFPRN